MACSFSNILIRRNDNQKENKKEENEKQETNNQHILKKEQKKRFIKFVFFSKLSHLNLLLFTNYLNTTSEFTLIIENLKEKT